MENKNPKMKFFFFGAFLGIFLGLGFAFIFPDFKKEIREAFLSEYSKNLHNNLVGEINPQYLKAYSIILADFDENYAGELKLRDKLYIVLVETTPNLEFRLLHEISDLQFGGTFVYILDKGTFEIIERHGTK